MNAAGTASVAGTSGAVSEMRALAGKLLDSGLERCGALLDGVSVDPSQ